MNLLHQQYQWELARDRQAEMIRDAQKMRLLHADKAAHPSIWERWFGRRSETVVTAVHPVVAPEVG